MSELIISEDQLKIWANTGSDVNSQNIFDSLKNSIKESETLKGKEIEIFLQGSFASETHIRGESDVDIVVRLKEVFNSNKSELPILELEKHEKRFPNASYSHDGLRKDLISHLLSISLIKKISEGNKSIKVTLDEEGYKEADIVPCVTYKKYINNCDSFVEGISIKRKDNSKLIFNFPKQHIENGNKKNRNTNNSYKKIVRIFKNIRVRMIEKKYISKDLSKSYFLESLIYNVPNDKFQDSLSSSLCNCINWINENYDSIEKCKSQNELTPLFGNGDVCWDIESCKKFISQLIKFVISENA